MAEKRSRAARWILEARREISDHRHRVRVPGELPEPLPRVSGDTSAPLVCRAVFEEVCILANGDVVCSCADSMALRIYGNMRRQPLAEILAGPMFREIREWQLASRPDRWCPAIDRDCPLRVSRATALDTVEGHLPRMLQLEPTSHCNLSCPACPVTDFTTDPRYTADRVGMLSFDEMVSIFEQLPSLEKVLFYNYGEAFVHPEAMPILRWIRKHRPAMQVHISTNGIALTPARAREVAAERLVDRMLFAIDGARPESYARYRVGGKLERALGAMRNLVSETQALGVRDRFEIWWQYILFEWNDSDEELAEARDIAAEIGVPLEWVVTHTEGASKRFLPGSAALAALVGGERAFRALSCDLKGAEIVRSGGLESIWHRADLKPASTKLEGSPGERILVPVSVRHRGHAPWSDGRVVRMGVRLLDPDGRTLEELRGVELPAGVLPETELVLFADLELPRETGSYHLLFDLVEEGVCWFSERGSSPALCAIEVRSEPAPWLRPSDLVAPALSALDRAVDGSALDSARRSLLAGFALEDQLIDLRRSGALRLATELALRSQIATDLTALALPPSASRELTA
jgi:MoaA/NifB/PqqE/SkfB family radical SAM enzyme